MNRSATLAAHLRRMPDQDNLFHYTPAAGVLGIGKSKEIWATHVDFLNDHRETRVTEQHAHNIVGFRLRTANLSQDEQTLFHRMDAECSSGARGTYIVSLTAHQDQLSQWRGYCPSDGGYAVGFPVSHLIACAKRQGYYLVPCMYDWQQQWRVMDQVVDSFLREFADRRRAGAPAGEVIKDVSYKFAQWIAEWGAVLKDQNFRDEAEWRLISPRLSVNDRQIQFRVGRATLIPYLNFGLADSATGDFPAGLVLRLGPRRGGHYADQLATQMAAHGLFNDAASGPSDIPYMPGSW